MNFRKIILIFLLFTVLASISGIASAEKDVSISWYHQDFGGSVSVLESKPDDYHENDNKEVKPEPQPTLDLPTYGGVFIFSTLIISFVVYFTKFKKYQKRVLTELLQIDEMLKTSCKTPF